MRLRSPLCLCSGILTLVMASLGPPALAQTMPEVMRPMSWRVSLQWRLKGTVFRQSRSQRHAALALANQTTERIRC